MKRLLALTVSVVLLFTGVIGYAEELAKIHIPAFLTALAVDGAFDDMQNEPGFVEYIMEQDGSFTLIMEKTAQDAELQNSKLELDSTISDLLEGAGEIASFIRIEYSEDVSVIDIYVDIALYTEWDVFSAITLALQGYFHQLLAGIHHEEMTGTVNIINESTGELIDSMLYRDMAESLLTPENLIEPEVNEPVDEILNAAVAVTDEVVTIEDVCEFAFEKVTISDRFESTVESGLYYPAEDGKKYVDISFYYKNLNTEAIMLDDDTYNGTLMYMGKYKYENAWIGAEYANRTKVSQYYSIDPLCTVYAHLLFQVPDEVAEAEDSLIVMVTIHGNTYEIDVREQVNNPKTEEQLPDLEIITEVQEKLCHVGLMTEEQISGIYDDNTIEAIKRFQEWVNNTAGNEVLTVNGTYDDLTLRYLEYCVDNDFSIG